MTGLTKLTICSLLAGMGVGAAVRWQNGAEPSGGDKIPSSSAVTITDLPSTGAISLIGDEDRDQQVEEALAILRRGTEDPYEVLKERFDSGYVPHDLILKWVEFDPEGLFAWMIDPRGSWQKYSDSDEVTGDVIQHHGLERAESIVNALPPSQIREQASLGIAMTYLEEDPIEAIRQISGLSDSISDMKAARNIAHRMAGEEKVDEIWDWLKASEKSSFTRLLAKETVELLADRDPEEALAAVNSNSELFRKSTISDLYEKIGETVASDDPELALQIGLEIEDPKMRRSYFREVGDGWSRSNTMEALEGIVDVINRGQKEEGLTIFNGSLFRLFNSKPEKAFELIHGIEDPETRDTALSRGIVEAVQDQPDLAAKELAVMIERNAPTAIEATRFLVEHWIGIDALKASEWLDQLPPSPHKDRGIIGLVGEVLKEDGDVEGARAWIQEIQEEKTRQSGEAMVKRYLEKQQSRSSS